jgi:hypothetical protein
MSDPYNTPPGAYNTPPGAQNPPPHARAASPARWTFIAIAAALLIGVGLWELSNRQDRSASNEPATVGQSERAPATPLPANPNGTVPQPEAR